MRPARTPAQLLLVLFFALCVVLEGLGGVRQPFGQALARARSDMECGVRRLEHERREVRTWIDVREQDRRVLADGNEAAIVDDAVASTVAFVDRDRDTRLGRLRVLRRAVHVTGGERSDERNARSDKRDALHSSTATLSPTSDAASRGSAFPASTAATPLRTDRNSTRMNH